MANNREVVVEKTEYNWLPIILIGGALFFFTQQKGCDLKDSLSNIFSPAQKSDLRQISEPSSEYKNAELVSFQNEAAKNKKKAALVSAFYSSFADIIERQPNYFSTTQNFREQHSNALDLAFQNDLELKDPELGTEIEAYLQKFISLNPEPFDANKAKNCLLALAWAASNA